MDRRTSNTEPRTSRVQLMFPMTDSSSSLTREWLGTEIAPCCLASIAAYLRASTAAVTNSLTWIHLADSGACTSGTSAAQ